MARYGWLGQVACLRPWAEQLLSLVQPRPGERCVDLCDACPTLLPGLSCAVGRDGAVVAMTLDPLAEAAATEEVRGRRLAPVAFSKWQDGIEALEGGTDVVVSLLGLCTVDTPAERLRELVSLLCRDPEGRLACLVWGAEAEVPHEAVLQQALRDVTGRSSPAIERLLQHGAPGAAERLVAAALAPGTPRLRVERRRDVVRFDGVDHYLGVLLDERPAVLGTPVDGGVRAGLRTRCEELLRPHTAADGTLRLPVEAAVIIAGI